MMNTGDKPVDFQVENCDLCVIGAGIAGINALFAASQYLGKDGRVILIDSKSAPGGMWNETYDYVRLHQPHKMFTAGNIEWEVDRDPAYLASKSEVLSHMRYCIKEIAEKISLDEMYGYTYESHEEVCINDNYEAHVICTPVSEGKKPLLIKANKCIKAFGFNVEQNEALALSSSQVNSITPNYGQLFSEVMAKDAAPIYIVGGGKTGMDTAYQLVTRFPKKQVRLIVGDGTVFTCRDITFSTGVKRWWGGATNLKLMSSMAKHFDGNNELDTFEYFQSNYGIALGDDFKNNLFGLLSKEENGVIQEGCDAIINDYLADVIDDDGKPVLIYRNGESEVIPAGSWFINCTGSLLAKEQEYEPYISEGGSVVSVQSSTGIFFLTSFAGYFLAHLLYLDKLKTLPLYELEHSALIKRNNNAWVFSAQTQLMYNTLLIMGSVPPQVMNDCHLDFDRWYPLHKRLMIGIKIKSQREKIMTHCENTLVQINRRFGIRCGILPSVESNRHANYLSLANS
jgi:ribulose 1,5-bisphosphate synthetase/thiazole synthase